MNARAMLSPMAEDGPDGGRSAGRDRPITILVAALGGEGGGVLTQWIVEAALHAGYPVQSTSIPGVAQRTGATTYYVEIHPEPTASLAGRRPVMNLAPVAGRIDLLIASELLEAVRAAQAGYVDRTRTTVIASTSRALTNREKGAMGDGREDDGRLIDALVANSRRHVGFDMNDEARAARTVISAVMFGAVAGSGILPFDRTHCEAAIRASGKGVDASLDGFARGFAHAVGRPDLADARSPAPTPAVAALATRAVAAGDVESSWPRGVRDIVGHGVERLVDYQDHRYADLYVERLRRVLALEDRLDPTGAHGHALTHETARFLALWMAFDDVVRVADLKTRPERYGRIRQEVGAGDDELVTVHDFFKPRVAEVAGALPAGLSRRVAAWEAARVRRGKAALAFPVKLRSDSRVGHLALRAVASMRRWRPSSQRYAAEQAAIDRWLQAIERVGSVGWQPAHALALCGRLIKGYGETHARGHENMARIVDTLTSDATIARFAVAPDAAVALGTALDSARDAALADPDGKALDRDIARHGAAPRPIVAKPLVFVRPKRAA